jgi:SNF2 family DNA or RNA helicase
MLWTPRPYMEDAVAFVMQRAGSGLLLDPGLGKTSITLACISVLLNVGEVRKTLIIAPVRVCYSVWPAEVAKWDQFRHLKLVNLHPLTSGQRAVALRGDADIFVINPESMAKVLPLLGDDFDLLVVDESTKFKDTQTQRFKALRPALLKFKRRMILTGTPVPNGLQDLFGQMFIVDLGESLGRYVTHFRNEFCDKHPSGFGFTLRRGAAENIYRRVENKLMRLDAKDHLQMPELIFNRIAVSLPPSVRRLYDELEEKFLVELEHDVVAAMSPAAKGMKLRQVANGFLYDDGGGTKVRETHWLHDEKLDALEELVEEMQGRPLLIAYEFEADATAIMKRFPQAVNLGADTKRVPQVIDQFNAGQIPVLIAHPASAGHGLNMQEACRDVCWYGVTWNRELYDQFNARVWRQGQKSSYVVVHSIVSSATKDDDVVAALESKDRTQKAFNEAIKRRR